MENYKIYCNLKSDLEKKKRLLANLKQSAVDEHDIISLEIEIEEGLNALNMVFNHLILHNVSHQIVETE